MEPFSCPYCRHLLTDEDVMHLRQKYASSRRKVASGGRNGGRPRKPWTPEQLLKAVQEASSSGTCCSMVREIQVVPDEF